MGQFINYYFFSIINTSYRYLISPVYIINMSGLLNVNGAHAFCLLYLHVWHFQL